MKSIYSMCIFCVVLMISQTACQYNEGPPPLNPNGDSELALVMRAMFEDGEKMKKQLEAGIIPTPSFDHSKLLTAKPTDPVQRGKPEYESFATGYLQIVESLKSANLESSAEIHTSMVDMCIACHKPICPGPIVKIEQLYTEEPFESGQ